VAVFASGLWFRTPAPPLKPAGPEAKPDDLVKTLMPVFPSGPTPEEEKLINNLFGGAGAAPHTGRPQATDPETAAKAAAAEKRRRQLEAKSAQRLALAAGARAREALDRWKSELDRWDALSAKLLDGDEGRPVAGGPEYVRQFRTVFQAERPSRGEYEQLRQSVEQAVVPIEAAAASQDDLLQPSQELVRSFATQAARATQAATAWREAIQEMNALALLARRRGLSGKTKLRQAIEDFETEMAVERLRLKDARLAEAEKKAAESDAAIAAAKVAAPAEQRLARAQEEAEIRRQGDLKTGTFWKGVVTSYGAPIQATMKITFRTKDDIRGSVSTAAGAGILDFFGTVNGTSLRLKRDGGGNERFQWSYQPATKTITGTGSNEGGQVLYTYSFRLVEERDE
jgi:hypothetical protein